MIGEPSDEEPKPIVRLDYPPEKFPLTLRLFSDKTGAVVWERTVTINDARALAKIEIPSFAGTEHYPVLSEIRYADGMTWLYGDANRYPAISVRCPPTEALVPPS